MNAAKYGLELRKKYGRGGTEVGIGMARRLARGAEVGIETVKHISRYFPRHAGDNLNQVEPPSNGHIAWHLWGGDAGWKWSKEIVKANK